MFQVGGHECRKVVCIHLHKSGQEKGEAAAALTGAPAATEAASADDHLKVVLTKLCISSSCCAAQLSYDLLKLNMLITRQSKTVVPLDASSPQVIHLLFSCNLP